MRLLRFPHGHGTFEKTGWLKEVEVRIRREPSISTSLLELWQRLRPGNTELIPKVQMAGVRLLKASKEKRSR